ncbi:Bax inhibitor-1/YccA family protein (plasmid) [Trichlorobacter lovleyi]|uniref:Bax inhibitor-1/YccA family protein n=1 Tax=Trichlorobacter lovleyi TaxID=313985 RepID=UPI002240063D|nr:Bax inhibitor-1/YccA family protein [Trichlorobacter lovleyi]QOX81050.1 Bax inhibitor-1/YccA family protein [Trichlorobacter lovleyi]
MDTAQYSTTATSVASLSSFYRQVYGKMTFGLFLTAFAAWFTASSPALQQLVFGSKMTFYVLIFAEIGLVIWLSAALRSLTGTQAMILFTLYSALNGVTLSVILLAYTGPSIFMTFVVTASMFGTMSLYGLLTKKDLSSWGSFFFMGLIGVLIASVVNIFLKSPAVYWVSTLIGVMVFTGLAAYDNFKLKLMATAAGEDERAISAASTAGALQLYLDFINLFLMLLRILGVGNKK